MGALFYRLVAKCYRLILTELINKMAIEEYNTEDIVIESDIDLEDSLVPVISRETEVEEQLLEQGEQELEDTLQVQATLEAYLNLIQSSGAVGLNETAAKVLKIGLEHLDRQSPEFTLSTAFESYNPEARFTLENVPSLENGFKAKLKAVGDKINALINWIVEQAHRIYTKYKEGINKLVNKTKDLEKRVTKIKPKDGLLFKIGNASSITINGEYKNEHVETLVGLAKWLAEVNPKEMIEDVKELDKILDTFLKQEGDYLGDAVDANIAVTHRRGDLLIERFGDLTLPGESRLDIDYDDNRVVGFKITPGEQTDNPLEIEVQEPRVIKSKIETLKIITGLLEKSAVENVKVNREIKTLQNRLKKFSNSDPDNDIFRKFSELIVKQIKEDLVHPTKSMLDVLRYIVKVSTMYLMIAEKEISMLED